MINEEYTTLDKLNIKHEPLDVYQRVEALYEDYSEDEIMLTSSFAATSAFLLKVFSDVNSDQIIYFIDTGYHFSETMIYKIYKRSSSAFSSIKIKRVFFYRLFALHTAWRKQIWTLEQFTEDRMWLAFVGISVYN